MVSHSQTQKHQFVRALRSTLHALNGLRRAVPVAIHRHPERDEYQLLSNGGIPAGSVVRVMPGQTIDIELPFRHSDQQDCPLCQNPEIRWALGEYAGRRELRITARSQGDPRWISVLYLHRNRIDLDVRALWAPPAQWVEHIPSAAVFTVQQREKARQHIEDYLEQGYGFQCSLEEPIGIHLVRRSGLRDLLGYQDGYDGGCDLLCRWVQQAEETALEQERENRVHFLAWLESDGLRQVLLD